MFSTKCIYKLVGLLLLLSMIVPAFSTTATTDNASTMETLSNISADTVTLESNVDNSQVKTDERLDSNNYQKRNDYGKGNIIPIEDVSQNDYSMTTVSALPAPVATLTNNTFDLGNVT